MSAPRRRASSRSPLALLVALRYLRSTRRDAFVTFLSATAAGGLALGTAALILALSALTGFQQSLREEILARTPELEIELADASGVEAARRALEELEEVASAQLLLRGQGWILSEGRARPVELVGFDGELPADFPGATSRRPGLYLSDRLARGWRLHAGDAVEVVSGRPTLSPFGPQPRIGRLALAGTYQAGRTEIEERLALPLARAERLLGRSGYRLVVATGDLDRAIALVPRLERGLPAGSRVRSWRDLNRGLFFALRLEKSLMFVAVFLIVLVAALALVSDLSLVIASKRAEIGMLGAMGARPPTLERCFLLLGALLAGIGVALGGVIGALGAWFLDRYRVLSLPGDVYFLDFVPFQVRAADVLAILAATVLLTLACALYAARRAAALSPVDALRR